MASRRSWGDFQVACRFDSGAVGRLVVWSTEESHPLNRNPAPATTFFVLRFFLICIFPLPLCSSSLVTEGHFLGVLLAAFLSQAAFVLVASLCQICFVFLSPHLKLPVSSIFASLLGILFAIEGQR